VRTFSCPSCAVLVFFENSLCLTCQTSIGFDRVSGGFLALAHGPTGLTHRTEDGRVLRPCANLHLACCNWLAASDALGGLCDCCLLTRTRPHDNDHAGLVAFARAETAKRRLLYQLDDLDLPVVTRREDPAHGLAFDLLSSASGPVVTGHANGVITLDLAEGDDGHREMLRVRLAEPYRTLLGHFRHEIGHFYWTVLVEKRAAWSVFRVMFGDERADYARALSIHYDSPPPARWWDTHVSIYATAHPWEDWAETFAHYLHIRDTLQTASSFGVLVTGPAAPVRIDPAAPLAAMPVETQDDFDLLIDTWLPLTYALNGMNRSMGKDDLYPFVLSQTVVEKLRLVHELIISAGGHAEARAHLQGA
jgi:hypothetical protein